MVAAWQPDEAFVPGKAGDNVKNVMKVISIPRMPALW